MTSLFGTVSLLRFGYDREEVDDFFEHAREVYEGTSTEALSVDQVQAAAFDLVRGGYRTHEVDSALDRVEAAFVAARRHEVVTSQGTAGWNAALVERAQTLYGRLGRPRGDRFAPPARGHRGYDRAQVDAACDRLVDFFDTDVAVSAHEIRTATFRGRRGRRAYEEASVDAFLRRAVEVLVAVE